MDAKDILRLIFGFGAFGIAMLLEEAAQYSYGREELILQLIMMGLCIFSLIMLIPVGFRGAPEAILRNLTRSKGPSGGPFSSEAMDYFESHPYETTYTDSHGGIWDNVYSDD